MSAQSSEKNEFKTISVELDPKYSAGIEAMLNALVTESQKRFPKEDRASCMSKELCAAIFDRGEHILGTDKAYNIFNKATQAANKENTQNAQPKPIP